LRYVFLCLYPILAVLKSLAWLSRFSPLRLLPNNPPFWHLLRFLYSKTAIPFWDFSLLRERASKSFWLRRFPHRVKLLIVLLLLRFFLPPELSLTNLYSLLSIPLCSLFGFSLTPNTPPPRVSFVSQPPPGVPPHRVRMTCRFCPLLFQIAREHSVVIQAVHPNSTFSDPPFTSPPPFLRFFRSLMISPRTGTVDLRLSPEAKFFYADQSNVSS